MQNKLYKTVSAKSGEFVNSFVICLLWKLRIVDLICDLIYEDVMFKVMFIFYRSALNHGHVQ